MEKLTVKEARAEYKKTHGKIVNEDVDGFVVLKHIDKIYPNHVQAVYDFNLSIKPHEFIVLVGPSGCGKSTTLRMIAGLEEISDGYLYIDKVVANHLESKDRNIAMVFQSYALYPNMSVYDNIAFGLKVKKMPKEEIDKRVFAAAEMLDLGPYLDRRPKELSGGQMQRVALGRAIVRDAKVFLMDEPLSNLDAKLRVQTRSKIVKIHRDVGATTVYVTHDQTEAMTMADRIVVMNHGFIQQIGTPKEVYRNPKNLFVAAFIGTPPMNTFKAEISENKVVCSDGQSFLLPESKLKACNDFYAKKANSMKDLRRYCALLENKIIENELNQETDEAKLMKTLDDYAKDYPLFTNVFDTMKDILGDESIKPSIRRKKALKAYQEAYYVLLSITKRIKSASSTSFNKVEAPLKKEEKKSFLSLFRKKKEENANPSLPSLDSIKAEFMRLESVYEADKKEKKNAFFGIRPENVHLYEEKNENRTSALEAEVSFSELLGSEYLVYLSLLGANVIMKLGNNKELKIGEKVKVCFDLDELAIFDEESGENTLWESK